MREIEAGKNSIELVWALVKEFITAGNFSFNINYIMKPADEKCS
jgi:hypothetical protein